MANTAVVYDRQYGDQELNFEASGGLLDAALVMRDRESDSWWAIMKGVAIGGERDGEPLVELPLGEKTTWGIWVEKHPETLVLSVDGMQYDESKPYANYFTSDGTFRGAEVADDRLAPKEAIYSFQHQGQAFAISNRSVENGLLLDVPQDDSQRYFFYRQPGLSLFGSTQALLVPANLISREEFGWGFADEQGEVLLKDGASVEASQEPLARLAAAKGVQRLDGFDTFWYTWIAVNPDTKLLP